MRYTADITKIENIFDTKTIVNIIEKAVNELPKMENGFVLDIDDWNIGLTNRQYAMALMLKNKIKNIFV